MKNETTKHTLFIPFVGADALVSFKLAKEFKPDSDVYVYFPGVATHFSDLLGNFGSALVVGAMDATSLKSVAARADDTTWIRPNVPDDFAIEGVTQIITKPSTTDGCASLVWDFLKPPTEPPPPLLAYVEDATMGHHRLPNAWDLDLAMSILQNPAEVDVFHDDYIESASRICERSGVGDAALAVISFLDDDKEPFDDQVGMRYAMFSDITRFRVGCACASYYARSNGTSAFAFLHGPSLPSLGLPQNRLLAFGAATTKLEWFNTTYTGMTVYDTTAPDTEDTADTGGKVGIIGASGAATIVDATGRPIRKS